jgi:hypothetical protein
MRARPDTEQSGAGGKLLHRDVPQRWKPWKLAIADVDGNGRKEIVLGVHKGTRFFPQPHNCLFVFNWDGLKTSPKWLGSSLSKPFSDFTFANLDNDRALELLSVETRPDGQESVSSATPISISVSASIGSVAPGKHCAFSPHQTIEYSWKPMANVLS